LQKSQTFWKPALSNNRSPTECIHPRMDDWVAKIKKLLEDDDPTITVEEYLPPARSDDEERESEGNPQSPIN
jgi:hypothetical protein